MRNERSQIRNRPTFVARKESFVLRFEESNVTKIYFDKAYDERDE